MCKYFFNKNSYYANVGSAVRKLSTRVVAIAGVSNDWSPQYFVENKIIRVLASVANVVDIRTPEW